MAHEILVVDDEADIRNLLADILKDEGYSVRTAGSSDQALEAVRTRQPHLVLLDIWLQGSSLDGLQILEKIQADHPGLPVVMMSGHGTIETAVGAIKQGAYDFVEKPFKSDHLLHVLDRAIEAAKLRREVADLKSRTSVEFDLTGASQAIAAVRQAIEKVAPTNSRVLITGAPGTGKEVVARALHAQSRRASGPFVGVNCAIMHPDRIETELFGSDDGEGGRRVGLFEQAHGGTLLLDEVADMPLATQGKIVRALQEQTFERVGGRSRVEVDVRVIASSNRDLATEMAEGRFREDLYYRLNVVPIRIPSLRERTEDIPDLVRYFVRRATEINGLPPREIGEDALASLQAYDWPGNIRELRNTVERLLIMAPGDPRAPIRADMLPPEISAKAPAVLAWDKGGEIMSLPLREAREVFERDYLLAQVNRFGGNISRTASFVGMERSALHRKLKSLGVNGTDRKL